MGSVHRDHEGVGEHAERRADRLEEGNVLDDPSIGEEPPVQGAEGAEIPGMAVLAWTEDGAAAQGQPESRVRPGGVGVVVGMRVMGPRSSAGGRPGPERS